MLLGSCAGQVLGQGRYRLATGDCSIGFAQNHHPARLTDSMYPKSIGVCRIAASVRLLLQVRMAGWVRTASLIAAGSDEVRIPRICSPEGES
jgi:hypothetical protein